MEEFRESNGAFDEYNDFVQKNGKIIANKKAGFHSKEMLEMLIEEYVLMIKSESGRLDFLDPMFMNATRKTVGYMAELAECITARYFNGKYMELSGSMIDLLIRDFRTSIRSEKNKRVSIKMLPVFGTSETAGLISCVKGFNFFVNDEAILGIRTFEDDRFNNEAMVSCNQSRYHGFSKASRLISKNYIFGENGVFVNASNRSFLDTFDDTGRDDFNFNPDLKYYYFPYAEYVDGNGKYSYIDRKEGIKKVFFGDFCKTYRFKPILLDCAFVGGPLKNNEEVMEEAFKCYEVSNDTKKLVKSKQDE